mmetsp:Transcript_29666/g.60583  ORF Transcript_29666/g.60583 Transcript_29666/m.60583 type:complete len:89 (+) Transcript_29666:38-304(+)
MKSYHCPLTPNSSYVSHFKLVFSVNSPHSKPNFSSGLSPYRDNITHHHLSYTLHEDEMISHFILFPVLPLVQYELISQEAIHMYKSAI